MKNLRYSSPGSWLPRRAARPGSDALIDISIRRTTVFTLLFNQGCIRVKGTAVKSG